MKKELRKYHKDVIELHNTQLFDELIYEHHVSSTNLKEIEFDTCIDKGYFALKDKKRYWIEQDVYPHLPIRASDHEQYKYKEDVVFRPQTVVPFKITPEQVWESQTEFVNQFLPFNHTEPLQYKVAKIVAIIGYVGKNFICMTSNPEFGKSSSYEFIHAVTNMSPVFEPTTKPGILQQITTYGNMVFDDVFSAKKEVRDVMETINYQIGGGKSVYINGSLATKNTKAKYNCMNQSLTYLYNRYDDYKDQVTCRVRRYWHSNMWDNIKAMDSRFLKLKFEGDLNEGFQKNFNLRKTATDNKMYYIQTAKHLMWLQQVKEQNKYKSRYTVADVPRMNNRRKEVYYDILWLIDMVSVNEIEYKELKRCLDKGIEDYQLMERQAKKEVLNNELRR